MRRAHFALLLIAAAACDRREPSREHVDMLFGLDPRAAAPAGADQHLVARGQQLFAVRCARCHPHERRGQDGRTHERNTLALTDVSRQLLFGWDGAVSGLDAMVARELQRRCDVAAPAADEVAALVAFLAAWRTHDRWDRYVEGDDASLSADERHGLATFVEVGCAACHAGRTLGGRSRHKLGAVVAYASADSGLHAATGREADRDLWKAPMLRHAAATGPWLHDGSVADLGEVVRLMGRHELGRELNEQQVAAIVTFLRGVAGT